MGESQNDWQRIKVTLQYSTSAAFDGDEDQGEWQGRIRALWPPPCSAIPEVQPGAVEQI